MHSICLLKMMFLIIQSLLIEGRFTAQEDKIFAATLNNHTNKKIVDEIIVSALCNLKQKLK